MLEQVGQTGLQRGREVIKCRDHAHGVKGEESPRHLAWREFPGLRPFFLDHLDFLMNVLGITSRFSRQRRRFFYQLFSEELESDRERLLAGSSETDETGAYATAIGRKNGRPARCDVGFSGRFETPVHGTTIPLAVAALGILRGEVRDVGVFGLEQVFEPATCVRRIAEYCSPRRDGAPLLDEAITFLA